MSDPRHTLAAAADLAARGRPFVMATVVGAKGRTPRDPGARMLFVPGAGAHDDARPASIIGTVGGGRMEQMVIEAARLHLERRTSGIESLSLLQDADQCCGGSMDVFVEYVGPRGRIVIFGAGHVSMALARVLEGSALEVVVADDRADWNTPERFPGATRLTTFDAGLAAAADRPGETSVCVMTYDHDTDFRLLHAILDHPPLPVYVGLIGSRSKRACFFGRLAGAGIGADRIERVECPMGLGDMGKAPGEVAASIAGRLLLVARAHAST